MHGDIQKSEMLQRQRRETYLERPLPSSEDSERCVLGGVLLDNDLMSSVAESLEPSDFYSPLHRRIFKAMQALFSASSPINALFIAEELKKEGPIESMGGIITIANLTYGIPHFTQLEKYIGIIREKSDRRKLIRWCSEISEQALSADTELDALLLNAQTQIASIGTDGRSSDGQYFPTVQEVIDADIWKALDQLRHGQGRKLSTGFRSIDNAIGGGIAPSDVLLVAADTGAGKSAFALQLAYQMTEAGYPAAFLAGEMTNSENVLRLLSQLSGITNLNWMTHISETEYRILIDWAQGVQKSQMHFEHRISDMQTLRTHLTRLVRQKNIRVLVIDYIQLFKIERLDGRKRNERIAEASQETKRIANELGLAVIEVAQFNREGAKSAQAGLHDLEGSGQLEKDASLIFILSLGETEFSNVDNRKYLDAKLRIVKGRNVGRTELLGRFYAKSVKFEF